jgi:hypothetical protein
MTPQEFDQEVRAIRRRTVNTTDPGRMLREREDAIWRLIQRLSNEDFKTLVQSPPPADQPQHIGYFLARCIRDEALRRAEERKGEPPPEEAPTFWERLGEDWPG